ncbi:MAG: ABC transporter ATP-binding protein [Alphaproteobacteria bacterium]
MTALDLKGLSVTLGSRCVLDNLSLTINKGEIVGLVGASGSGKSMTARALCGLLPTHAKTNGTLTLNGEPIALHDVEAFAAIRGRDIGLIFQDPAGIFNPLMSIGDHVAEALVRRGGLAWTHAREKARIALDRAGLPNDIPAFDRYPHEVSGGQRQRAMIAAALALSPKILIADEPTTALDVTTETGILALLRQCADEDGLGILLISHDLPILERIADRLLLMKNGRIVESSTLPLSNDTAPELARLYALGHKASIHAAHERRAPLLQTKSIGKTYSNKSQFLLGSSDTIHALKNISLSLGESEIVAVVGESGSGKSTLARILAGLDRASQGEMIWTEGKGRVQMVFQDPAGSLNPRWTIGQSIGEPLSLSANHPRVAEAARDAGLDPAFLTRYPHQISGGQAQRAAIARAIIRRPDLLILDEPVSALDFEIRDQILSLLERLRAMHGIAMIFITHDISAARRLSDRMIVLDKGEIVESGITADIFSAPDHAMTKALLAASSSEERVRS